MKKFLIPLVMCLPNVAFALDDIKTIIDPVSVARLLIREDKRLTDSHCIQKVLDLPSSKAELAMGNRIEGLTFTYTDKEHFYVSPIFANAPQYKRSSSYCKWLPKFKD